MPLEASELTAWLNKSECDPKVRALLIAPGLERLPAPKQET